jgi:hypothetical protein
LVFFALPRGIFLWLAGHGAYPDRWVAEALGYAEVNWMTGAAPWLIAALFGLLGLALGEPIFGLGARAWNRWAPAALQHSGSGKMPDRVPLWDALRFSYEKSEGTLLAGFVDRMGDTTRKKFGYFWAMLYTHKVPVYAAKPPSTVPRQLDPDELKNIILFNDSGDLAEIWHSDKLKYQNAFVLGSDLTKFIGEFDKEIAQMRAAGMTG